MYLFRYYLSSTYQSKSKATKILNNSGMTNYNKSARWNNNLLLNIKKTSNLEKCLQSRKNFYKCEE